MDICNGRKILICVSILLWISSACVSYVGYLMFSEYLKYSEIVEPVFSFLPSICYFVAAALMFIVAVIGIIAAFRQFHKFIAVYYTSLLLVLSVLGFAAVTSCLYSYSIKDSIAQDVDNSFSFDYGGANKTLLTEQVDNLQQNMECCGIKDSSDWSTSNWIKGHKKEIIPLSCCPEFHCNVTDPISTAYQKGCSQILQNEYWMLLLIIFIFATSFIFVEVVCIFISCVLMCRRHDREYNTLQNPVDVENITT